jgi:Ferritin-like
MRFEMTRHLGALTRDFPTEKYRKSRTAKARSTATDLSPDSPPAEFSWTDYLAFLLYIDAEIEHGLMVQYLYAGYSLGGPQVPEQHRNMIRGWQEVILGIAKEEMGHLISVQNVLYLIGAPLNFTREDFPWDTDFYPFAFSLEPLSLESLACYVFAESPVDWSGPEAEEVKNAMKHTTGSPHQVSALFREILKVIKDSKLIPDDVFQADSWPYQANWDQWGRGYHSGNRGNATGANPPAVPNVLVAPVASRDDAVSSLTNIAEQGELPPSDSLSNPSHFARFLKIFHEMKALQPEYQNDGWSPSRNVAFNPYIPGSDGVAPPDHTRFQVPRDAITNPEAVNWAQLFNVRYRMLLNFLIHSYDLADGTIDTGPPTPLATLINATFGEMYNLRAIASIMVETPLSDDPRGKTAGPPFEMPYTLSRPAGEINRWRMHKRLLLAAEPLIERTLKLTPAARHRYLNSLREADCQLLQLINAILDGYATKAL